jgi:tetratricopeptide (TPR) repeat protein
MRASSPSLPNSQRARAKLSWGHLSRVFLALAQFNLSRPVEAEETYKKAVELNPSQPLARQVRFRPLRVGEENADLESTQGLASFYEKQQRWGEYAGELQGLMGLFEERCVRVFLSYSALFLLFTLEERHWWMFTTWPHSKDAPKYAEALEKLLDVRRKFGTKEEVRFSSLGSLLIP